MLRHHSVNFVVSPIWQKSDHWRWTFPSIVKISFTVRKSLKLYRCPKPCLCGLVWGRDLGNGGLWVFINWVWIFLKILLIRFPELESFFQNHHITGEAIPCLWTLVSWWRGRFISHDNRICENLPLPTKFIGVSLLLTHYNIVKVGDFYFHATGAV